MRNLLPEELHPRVRFITGSDKAFGMMQGIEETGSGAVFFVGYHAKAGTLAAPLAHTWTSYLLDIRIGDVSTGEYGINAAVAGHFGAQVVLVTGDDKAVAQTQAFLAHEMTGVAVKTGYSSTSALHHHPEQAQALIRQGAEAALQTFERAKPWVLPADARIELEFDHPSRADACLYLNGVERTSVRSVGYTARDGVSFFRTFRALMRLSDVRLSP